MNDNAKPATEADFRAAVLQAHGEAQARERSRVLIFIRARARDWGRSLAGIELLAIADRLQNGEHTRGLPP